MSKSTLKPTVPVTTPMLPALERRARLCAGMMGISRAEFVRRAVAAYVEEMSPQAVKAAQVGVQS